MRDDGPPAGSHAEQGRLVDRLVAAGLGRPAPGALTPLAGGTVNRVWRWRRPGGDLVLKLYAARGASPLFPNDPVAEWRALTALSGTGLAPEPVATLPGHPYGLVYGHVEGTPWSGDPAPVGAALARLHALDPPPGLRQVGAGTAFIHGDPVPGNILVSGARSGARSGAGSRAGLRFIDWQCPGAGDPVHDLALFLSPAMQVAAGREPLTDAAAARFLDAYGDPDAAARLRAQAAMIQARVAAHCRWRIARSPRRAPLYAAALRAL